MVSLGERIPWEKYLCCIMRVMERGQCVDIADGTAHLKWIWHCCTYQVCTLQLVSWYISATFAGFIKWLNFFESCNHSEGSTVLIWFIWKKSVSNRTIDVTWSCKTSYVVIQTSYLFKLCNLLFFCNKPIFYII